MPANYKRKRLIEDNYSDKKPTHIRKSLNSSERIKAKKQIKKTLNDRHNTVEELRGSLEMSQSSDCYRNELFGPQTYIEDILSLLDVGDFKLYRCTCIDVYELKDEEVLRMHGL